MLQVCTGGLNNQSCAVPPVVTTGAYTSTTPAPTIVSTPAPREEEGSTLGIAIVVVVVVAAVSLCLCPLLRKKAIPSRSHTRSGLQSPISLSTKDFFLLDKSIPGRRL